jgi:8-oxo-dGTP pyrophosphatase MutT (NUDIX family)
MVPKIGKSKNGKPMHYSVGALIEKDGKYLLIDRAIPPFGFAGIAGHIDEGEDKIQALIREVEEESRLKVEEWELIFEEELDWNWCSKGVGVHYWYLFKCKISGETQASDLEVKSIGWHSVDEIKQLNLEPVWEYWFKKLKMI